MKKENLIYFTVIIGLVVISRLVPHPSNFTAVGAVVVLGSLLVNSRNLVGFSSLIALLVSDLILGVHNLMPFTYGAVIISTLILPAIQPSVSWAKLGIYSVLSSSIFYLVTNFGVWFMPNSLYTQDVSGLVQCYVAGLPFLKMEFMGTLFYSALGFSTRRMWVRASTEVLVK